MQIQVIQQKIFEIRGQKVMLDFDLAELYEVETKVFNQAVKRNIDSFPEEFMFRLTAEEWQYMRSQIVTLYAEKTDNQDVNRSQIVTSSLKHRGAKYLPYAFTEHGVTMLASVLKSEKARKMNIAIVRAFIAMRKFLIQYSELLEQLNELRERIGNHDAQLNQIYDAIENLLDEKQEHKSWKDRERIGFKK
jgi:phage regulator Rha-like protein